MFENEHDKNTKINRIINENAVRLFAVPALKLKKTSSTLSTSSLSSHKAYCNDQPSENKMKISRSKTGFVNLNIKKSTITRKAGCEFEFVPLASPTTIDKSTSNDGDMLARFDVDLDDDLEQWNAELLDYYDPYF